MLLVEDDSSNAEALKLLLEMETSSHITHFSQASDVLVHLPRIQAMHPVLFLLTHRLPAMNALDLYRALHATEGLERVPAIILSGNQKSDEDKEHVFQQGLLFMPKPYNIDELLQTIRRIIG